MNDTETIADVIVAAVRVATATLTARCESLDIKVSALEARAPVAGPKGDPGPRGDGGANGKDADPVDVEAIAVLAATLVPKAVDGKDGRDGVDGKNAPDVDVEAIAQRAAAMVPAGKAGRDGVDGRDGQPGVPGRDGKDGLGIAGERGQDGLAGRDGTLEGVTVEQVDERTVRLLRADGVEIGRFLLSVPLYKGVYAAGASYAKGDAVTFGGSLWIARETTADKPGDGATKWQLAVKAGREGREGKPGKDGAQGPKGERGDAGRNFS